MTYVTSAVEANNEGFQYQCAITDTYGSEYMSDIAVLHVALEMPNTGDEATLELWLAMCILSLFGMGFVYKRQAFKQL